MKKFILVGVLFAQFVFAQQNTSTSTTSTSAGASVTAAPTSRHLQLSYKNETTSNLQRSQIKGGGATTDNQAKVTYLLGDTLRFGFLASAKTYLPGRNEFLPEQKWIAGDLAAVVESIYGSVLGSDKMYFEGRLYFPTSEGSQKGKQDFMVRADLTLPYSINNSLTSSIYLRPRIASKVGANDYLDLLAQAKLQATVSKYVAPYAALNHYTGVQQAAVYKKAIETLGPEVGADLTVNSMVKFNLAIMQDRQIYQPSKTKVRPQYALFDTKETQYMLKAQIKY